MPKSSIFERFASNSCFASTPSATGRSRAVVAVFDMSIDSRAEVSIKAISNPIVRLPANPSICSAIHLSTLLISTAIAKAYPPKTKNKTELPKDV